MKKRIKVLLVSPYNAKRVGGIGTWSKIVLDYSEKQNDAEIQFLNTVQGLPKRWALKRRLTHLIIGLIDSFLIIVRLFWQMLASRPDVVHYTSSAGSALNKDLLAIWIVKNLFHKKFVIHWHFGRIPVIFEEKGRECQLFTKMCNKTDISIVIDLSSYNVLQRENVKSVFVPNPIPVALQHEVESIPVNELLVDRNEGEVLFVGHVLKTKGIYELVQACSGCENVRRLVVVGPIFDEQIKNELVALANKRDSGNWLQLVGEKSREEVWKYYKTCDLFCLPSYSEGFPYVVLEAMAFACPIVATKVGAIPEMLANGSGELIESHQIDSIKVAINKILSDPETAAEMGKKAHAKVLKDFTIETIFQQYFEVWNSTIN